MVNYGAAKKNLSGADLSNANLQGVNFEEANLTNAKLSNSILRYGNLTNANLTNSDLVGANVCGVDLDRANFKGARLKSIVSDRRTKLPTLNSHKNNFKPDLTIKERSIELQTSASSFSPTKIQHHQNQPVQSTKVKKKSGANRIGILLIAIVATVTATGYIFWTQNPEYPWSLKLKIWRSQLEQLMP
ncbi:MAG: pentapeptide repeat-containing protein [Pleurocapsa sp. CRU_1_2]|nr:pentapeptide repeat-containing protein [Pleurocapsa sp. CRU_1_2]